MTYDIIKRNFMLGLWNEQMVRIAMEKGIITNREYEEIVNKN